MPTITKYILCATDTLAPRCYAVGGVSTVSSILLTSGVTGRDDADACKGDEEEASPDPDDVELDRCWRSEAVGACSGASASCVASHPKRYCSRRLSVSATG